MPFPVGEFLRFQEEGNPFIAQERSYDLAALERYVFPHTLFEFFSSFYHSLASL
jgi:hypothetical protein